MKNTISLKHEYLKPAKFKNKRVCYSRVTLLSDTPYSASVSAKAKFHNFSGISIDIVSRICMLNLNLLVFLVPDTSMVRSTGLLILIIKNIYS